MVHLFRSRPNPTVTEVQLGRKYSFMYENFVLLTQESTYLFLEKDGQNFHALQFDSPYSRYGGPNDEAHGGHPLTKHGLGAYGLYEVTDSPWIEEMMVANRVHPRHSDALYSGYRHYIACFKDVKFESVCRHMKEVLLQKSDVQELLARELENLEA